MAKFKICVRGIREDCLQPVYIRVTHNRKVGYIKTGKAVDKDGVRGGEVIDPAVSTFCFKQILRYNECLNSLDLDGMSVSEIVDFLKGMDDDLSFSEFARHYIRRMAVEWKMERNSKTYRLALSSLEKYMQSQDVLFTQVSVQIIHGWISYLGKYTHRAKEQYPTCVKVMFRAALDEFNDYDRGIIRIKNDPFRKIRIPRADIPEKRALKVDILKKFFSGTLPPSKMIAPLPEWSRDVAEMVFCLAGINTADLYSMKKDCLRNGVLCYQRRKTMKFRRDGAYLEIRVPDRLMPLFDKYRSDDDYLFSFHLRHQDLDCFNVNVNRGLKPYCAYNGLPPMCMYTFRHSWATIAKNNCGASTEEVGFALNHSSAHKVTERYIQKDFTPISRLNDRVLSVVFDE